MKKLNENLELIPIQTNRIIEDFIDISKANPILKLIGDSYDLLMKNLFEIIDNPDLYYSYGSRITIESTLSEDLYIGDMLLLWLSKEWIDNDNIILSILHTKDKMVKIFYDSNDHQVKSSIEDCNGYGNNYTASALMAIIKRDNFQRDTGYDFTAIEPLPIEVLIKKLQEREYGNQN